MSSEVRHLVDSARPFPVVRLSGVLDGTTTGTVRDVLLDVLAGQPPSVVVDVGELAIGEAQAVGVLREVAEATQWWPGAHLTLCNSRADVWQGLGWELQKDPPKEPDDDKRLSLELEPHVSVARHCREVITETCERWERADLAGSACIVATELVNNVVAHARTPMIVLIATRSDGLSVAVRDGSAHLPAYAGAPVSPTAYGGRGMLLIDSVASRWGSLLLADGKVVWALLS
ncbi:anti-anti-sigma factor [Actinoplanes sp. CA-142083]|uniref:anti-anti-sigma factor n=1 Tax=Actinoplanes sp. CA-142083 TaxID=3239903 RepID=UPI003D8DFD52